PVFSMSKLARVDVSLGPEMRSTGEVLGVGKNYMEALFKGFVAAGTPIPKNGARVLVSVRDIDKENFLPIAEKLKNVGCKFIATAGTAKFLQDNGYEVDVCKKISEGIPNVLDIIRSGMIDMVIDIPKKSNNSNSDGFKMRRCAAECSIPMMTSLDTVWGLVKVMSENLTFENTDIVELNDVR
ncbi:MAG: carbamoyl-phosphate synthase large subunit, partial [Clostridia bacterium]|nr:carbamoyl-phosphate synthase large subunit [Clostridia bacterium]